MRALAARTGHTCAYLECGKITSIRSLDDDTKAISIGVGAHEVAAGKKGPRPQSEHPDITEEQIRCARTNGIWLCADHAIIVDRNPRFHDRAKLQEWQRLAEETAAQGARYGRLRPITVGPDQVAARARMFINAIRDVLPQLPFRIGATMDSHQVQQMRGALVMLAGFGPLHPMFGIEAGLVASQNQAIDDLRAFVAFFEDRTLFVPDGNGILQVVDNKPGTRIEAEQRQVALWGHIHTIGRRWVQGEAYYGPSV
ncbi:hypothetical protein DWU99_01205 [Dyella psychrodurans]|uniref:Uncharacterized protein n=1 Tax=Dyella psychrodurans TaxID=1927960 RepID=A0A370XCI0_9GAMM|nr:hypothetical protein DWU99_01205 [Dyella psychrodurans]